jgi:hypothetical protein
MAVQAACTYIHALNGRLRIKVPAVKGSPVKALEIEGKLQAIEGINCVKGNPMTGNVLILYQPDKIGHQEVMGALERLGYLREIGKVQIMIEAPNRMLERISETLAETLVRSTIELAVQRLVSSLI